MLLPFCGPGGRQEHASSALGLIYMLLSSEGGSHLERILTPPQPALICFLSMGTTEISIQSAVGLAQPPTWAFCSPRSALSFPQTCAERSPGSQRGREAAPSPLQAWAARLPLLPPPLPLSPHQPAPRRLPTVLPGGGQLLTNPPPYFFPGKRSLGSQKEWRPRCRRLVPWVRTTAKPAGQLPGPLLPLLLRVRSPLPARLSGQLRLGPSEPQPLCASASSPANGD